MRSRLWPRAALLAGCVFLAFGGSLTSGFHFDDYAIFADHAIRSPAGWREIWTLQQTRPLTYLTFWFNYQFGGQQPFGYHALNLALHLAAVLLLWTCLRRLTSEGWALFGAAVFAAHPLQAEAVDYVWGRSVVLAALFVFAAWRAWLRDRPWQAVAWFAAALLAKEEVAAFPLVLFALSPKRRGPIAAMLGLSALAATRIVYATSVIPGAVAGIQAGISPWHYFLAQGVVIWRYARMLVLPWGFNVDPEIAVPPAWLGLAAWALIIALAIWLWRRKVLVALPLLALLPSSSLFPAQDLAADRRMYLAIALCALVWPAVSRAPRWLAYSAVAALLCVSVWRTWIWQSDERLWREATIASPDKVRPKLQLARALPSAEALPLLAEASRLAPNDPAIPAETGTFYLNQGDPAHALAEFGRALALDPRDARNYNNRGVALAALGQSDAARADFTRALAIDPILDEARANLARLQ